MSAVEVREEPDNGARLAIKTELPTPRTWFVFGPGGGHYAPGTRSPDKVEDWPPYTYTPEAPDDGG